MSLFWCILPFMMKTPLRAVLLSIVGLIFFGLLLYVVIQVLVAEESQQATLNNTITVPNVRQDDSPNVVVVDTADWDSYALGTLPISFRYPSDWKIEKVFEDVEVHVNQPNGVSSIKIYTVSYSGAPATAAVAASPETTQEEMDAARARINGSKDSFEVDGVKMHERVYQDKSSLSVIVHTDFFVGDYYTSVTLPIDVSEFYLQQDGTAANAAVKQLMKDVRGSEAPEQVQDVVDTYRAMVRTLEFE